MTTPSARQTPSRDLFASADPGWDRIRALKDKIAWIGVSFAFLLAMIPSSPSSGRSSRRATSASRPPSSRPTWSESSAAS